MDGPTLKRLGVQLRKEIVLLKDLPFTMRAALRQLAEKYDRQAEPPPADNWNEPSTSSSKGGQNDSGCKR